MWTKINTSGIRRCSRAVRVNMKPASEKVLPPRASRCDCPSCPSRLSVLSAQSSTIAPLRACRSWSCSARRCQRFASRQVSCGPIASWRRWAPLPLEFPQLGREKLAKVSDTFQGLPSSAVTHSMPTRSPVGHLRNPHVRVTSTWAGLSYADAQEVSVVNVLLSNASCTARMDPLS